MSQNHDNDLSFSIESRIRPTCMPGSGQFCLIALDKIIKSLKLSNKIRLNYAKYPLGVCDAATCGGSLFIAGLSTSHVRSYIAGMGQGDTVPHAARLEDAENLTP